MAIAHVQTKVENTDSFDDQVMVATFAGAVTVGNAVALLTAFEQNSRSVSSASGAAASFTAMEAISGALGLSVDGRAAIATATTAAQTVNSNDTTDFGQDVVVALEFSGVESPLNESGTSVATTITVPTTDHNFGTITPDSAITVYLIVITFGDDPEGISNGTGTDLADWTAITTGEPVIAMYYRIVNASASAVTFRITTGALVASNAAFFALNGTAGGGGGGSVVPSPSAQRNRRMSGRYR